MLFVHAHFFQLVVDFIKSDFLFATVSQTAAASFLDAVSIWNDSVEVLIQEVVKDCANSKAHVSNTRTQTEQIFGTVFEEEI
jgi:hypothetical protein